MPRKVSDSIIELDVTSAGVEDMPAEFKDRTVVSQTPIVVGGDTKKIVFAFGPKGGNVGTGQPEQQSGTSRPIPPNRRW